MTSLSEQSMFRGKHLPTFLEEYAPLYASLAAEHGIDKIYQVYDFLFNYISALQWGQYMVLDKICPEQRFRQLFFWCVECIYQSDLFSQLRFEHHPLPGDASRDEVRIVVVEPSKDLKQKWCLFLRPDRRYSFIDWFSRIRSNPKADPDINPAWLLLDTPSEADSDPSAEDLPD